MLLGSDGMPSKFSCACVTFALVTACAGGTVSDSGSVPLPTTATISGGPGTSVSDSGISDSDTSDGSATDGSATDGGTHASEPPTTDPPGTTDAPTSSGPTGATTGGGAVCGNNIGEPGEACDGMDFKGSTCADVGFGAGALACDVDCTLFTDGCFDCGDGSKAMAEACDGADLGGKTCQSEGFGSGTLSCAADCKGFNTAGCVPLPSCGNAVKEGSEQCDGAQLGGQTCVGLGFDQGTLVCSGSCTFDTANCTVLDCAGQGEFCVFDENNPQSNCCPPGVKENVLGICDIFICF